MNESKLLFIKALNFTWLKYQSFGFSQIARFSSTLYEIQPKTKVQQAQKLQMQTEKQ